MEILKKFFSIKSINTYGYLALPNTDTPRILIPLNSNGHFNVGFNIHNTASTKNRFVKSIFRNLYPIAKLLKNNIIYETREYASIRKILEHDYGNGDKMYFSFYIGTPSFNQKLTVQIMNQECQVLGYLKITDNEISERFIIQENNSSKYLNNLNIERFIYPKYSFFKKINNYSILFQEDISKGTTSIGYHLNNTIIDSLIELGRKSRVYGESSEYIESLVSIFRNVIKEKEIIIDKFSTIDQRKNELIQFDFPLVYVHGDFVPYNVRINNHKLVVFDWEFSRHMSIPGYDLFHFIFQGNFQIRKMDPKKLIRKILDKNSKEVPLIIKYFESLEINKLFIPNFLLFYFIEVFLFEININSRTSIKNNHFLTAIVSLIENKGYVKNGLYS